MKTKLILSLATTLLMAACGDNEDISSNSTTNDSSSEQKNSEVGVLKTPNNGISSEDSAPAPSAAAE